ncbi:hypothetical protein [Sorangium sp. So ce1024]|uniref:hypothetical protein n=1 Tax=Sorangium sp. So ce1024 TaxID=3133327 RepID=UPI003F052033
MSQLAASALFASYVACVQPESGAGRESGIVVRKWHECVFPHYNEPVSRQRGASGSLEDWDGSDAGVFVSGRAERVKCTVGAKRDFAFAYIPGEFDFDGDDES